MSGESPAGVARALIFNLLFFGWTLLYALLAWPFLIAPRPIVLAVGRTWNRNVFWLVTRVAGIKCEVRGSVPKGPVVIAAKHQSAFETLALPMILDDPLFVVKRELFLIPVFGWYLARLGYIGIDRSAGAAALRVIVRQAQRALAKGHSIIIFPEGTRVAPGQHREYGPGVAALYAMTEAPVVPVALNSGLFWGRRRFGKASGTVVVEFLPPIAPGLDRRTFMAELERSIESATNRLLAEGANRGI